MQDMKFLKVGILIKVRFIFWKVTKPISWNVKEYIFTGCLLNFLQTKNIKIFSKLYIKLNKSPNILIQACIVSVRNGANQIFRILALKGFLIEANWRQMNDLAAATRKLFINLFYLFKSGMQENIKKWIMEK